MLGRCFYQRPAEELAGDLLGCTLVTCLAGVETAGSVVEVEAYGPADPASHSYRGRTTRNWAMFEAGGCAYVYRSYGIHWCFNVVAGDAGNGEGVLVRALEPTAGLDVMLQRHRCEQHKGSVCRGPGRLTTALGISGEINGRALDTDSIWLEGRTGPHPGIRRTGRIGISVAKEARLRFVVPGSPFISGPRSCDNG